MMGLRFKTKKEAKAAVPFPASRYVIETSIFGAELRENGTFAVCVSLDPYTIRNAFAQITVKDGIVVKVA